MEKTEGTANYGYYCTMCRNLLFKEDSLEEHKTSPKKLKGGAVQSASAKCTSYFTSQLPWIEVKDYVNTGKLYCPNEKVIYSMY